MNSLGVLASPGVWGPVLGVVVVLVLIFYYGFLDAASLEGGRRDSLWFLGGGGRFEAAGREGAMWMIGLYLAGAAVLGYLVSLARGLFARRERTGVKRPRKGVEAPG